MTIIQAKPQARIFPTKLSSNLYIIQPGQTIQSVIDSCPVAAGSLKDGFTNPYVVRVPPGHEKEYYSLVRNAGDSASDKRNVKVIFEDNPEGKFIIDQWDSLDAIGDWYGSGITVIAIDSTHNFEGENCFKVSMAEGHPIINKFLTPNIDIRKYHGILVDLEIDPTEISSLTIGFNDKDSHYATIENMYASISGKTRMTLYFGLSFTYVQAAFDYSAVAKIIIKFYRKTGFSGTTTAYIDNIRFIRTIPHRAIILRFDDRLDEHWSIAAKLLDAKGWKGIFAVMCPEGWGGAGKLTLNQVKGLDSNGHDVINHTLEHTNLKDLSSVETYYNYNCMKNALEHYGINRTNRLFINPGYSSNHYLVDYLRESGGLSTSPNLGPFPTVAIEIDDPDFIIPDVLQKFVDSGIGGILQLIFHEITNEANFLSRLNWIKENFSEIILASEVVNRFPQEYQLHAQKLTASGIQKTLTGNFLLYPWHEQEIHLDPGGAGRNIIPVGSNPYGGPTEFRPFHRIELINTADAAETLTFDPTFTAAGNHDAAAHDTIMTDSGEGWTGGQLVGRTINNTTDGSSGVITANTATTVTAILSGGTDNDWDVNDTYTITPVGLNQAVGQDQRATFIYDGEGWDIINLYDKTP